MRLSQVDENPENENIKSTYIYINIWTKDSSFSTEDILLSFATIVILCEIQNGRILPWHDEDETIFFFCIWKRMVNINFQPSKNESDYYRYFTMLCDAMLMWKHFVCLTISHLPLCAFAEKNDGSVSTK